MVESVLFVERRLKIDDPVGAISVHGVNGAWGVLALGLFTDGSYGHGLNGISGGVRGFLFGDPGQLAASVLAIVTNIIYVGSTAFVTLTLLEKVVGNRVARETEAYGLDIPELGAPGYIADAEPAAQAAIIERPNAIPSPVAGYSR